MWRKRQVNYELVIDDREVSRVKQMIGVIGMLWTNLEVIFKMMIWEEEVANGVVDILLWNDTDYVTNSREIDELMKVRKIWMWLLGSEVLWLLMEQLMVPTRFQSWRFSKCIHGGLLQYFNIKAGGTLFLISGSNSRRRGGIYVVPVFRPVDKLPASLFPVFSQHLLYLFSTAFLWTTLRTTAPLEGYLYIYV